MFSLLMTLALAADPGVSGNFHIDQTESELEVVQGAAVQTTLESLPWALRGLVRRRVAGVITNCTDLSVAHTPSQLTLTCDDEPVHVVDLPAQGITKTDRNGNPMTVTVDVADTQMTVTFATGEGGVTTRYRPDGDKMHVQKTLFSPRLQEPVSWEVRYRRLL